MFSDVPRLDPLWAKIILPIDNHEMNDLNDGKDRFILMGTLFIVLFLFLL